MRSSAGRSIRADLPVAVASENVDETLRTQARDAGVQKLNFKTSEIEEFCDVVSRLIETASPSR